MSLEEAVELVIFAFGNAEAGDIMVQKAPACTIEVLAQAVKELFDADNEVKVIGIRHGEKMYETLLTNEECARAIDMGDFFRVPADQRDLNYDKYFVEVGGREYQILYASVTYFHLREGSQVSVTIPADNDDATWAAVEAAL